MSNPRRALIYCRVSSSRQKEEGHGLESQEQRCKSYAREKGYPVDRVFPDSMTGGGDFMARPAMVELLRYLDEHPGTPYVVVFDDLKRFARDTIFHLSLRQELQRRGATVECLNFRFEDTPEGVFVETVFAAQGQLEREQNRRQVLQKMKARLECGYWPFNPPPGYKSVRHAEHGKLLTPEASLAPTIVEALEGFASGRFTTQSDVEQFLATRGFHERPNARARRARRVHPDTVKRLLTCVLYTGYIEYLPWGVTLRKGHHKSLISLDTYQRIQGKLNRHGKVHDRADLRSDFPLRGLVLCARCLKPLTASWSTGRRARYPYYRCLSPFCELRTKSIPRNTLEASFEQVLETIEPSARRLAVVEAVVRDVWHEVSGNIDFAINQRRQERAELDHQIAVLVERIKNASSGSVIPFYEQEIEALSWQKATLEQSPVADTSSIQLGTAIEEVFKYLKNPLATWQSGILSDQRWLVKVLFSEPLVYHPRRGFGTAEVALPLAVSWDFGGSHSHDVDIIRRNWNRLKEYIIQAYNSRPNHNP